MVPWTECYFQACSRIQNWVLLIDAGLDDICCIFEALGAQSKRFLVASFAPDALAMFDIQATIRARLEAGPNPASGHPAPSASAPPGRSAAIPAACTGQGKALADSSERESQPVRSPRAFSEAGDDSETPRPKAHPVPKKLLKGRGRGRGGHGRGRTKKEDTDVTARATEGNGGENGEVDEPEDDADATVLPLEPKPKPKKTKDIKKRPAASTNAAMECDAGMKKPAASVEKSLEPETVEVDGGDKEPGSALKRPGAKLGSTPQAKVNVKHAKTENETKKEVRVLKSGWKVGFGETKIRLKSQCSDWTVCNSN